MKRLEHGRAGRQRAVGGEARSGSLCWAPCAKIQPETTHLKTTLIFLDLFVQPQFQGPFLIELHHLSSFGHPGFAHLFSPPWGAGGVSPSFPPSSSLSPRLSLKASPDQECPPSTDQILPIFSNPRAPLLWPSASASQSQASQQSAQVDQTHRRPVNLSASVFSSVNWGRPYPPPCSVGNNRKQK